MSGQFTDQGFDPFSSKTFSGMAQTDPGVQHDDQDVEEQGNTITGGYTYPGDDLPANFARQQQSHMYGDEASDEFQGSEEGVRGRNDDVSNPFTDEHGDMGMPSGGYGDERPIMGYNPFLNEQDRCRADGHEAIEEPYEQGEDTYQQNAGQDENHDESLVGHVSLEEAQYYRDQEQEDANRYQEENEYQGEHEDDQVNKQDYKEQENQHYEDKEDLHYKDKEDQHYEDKEYQHYEDKEYQHYEDKEDQYYGDKEYQHYEDKEDQHYEDKEYQHYGDKEDQHYEDKEDQHYEDKEDQHYEDKEDQHYEDKEDQLFEDKEDKHYEENVDEVEQEERQVNKDEQEVIPGYRKLEEDADDADLEMDPVENIQEANFKDKPVAVSCNLYGDGSEPTILQSEIVDEDKEYLADDTQDDTRQCPESTQGETFQGGEENVTEERFPETRAKFGEETFDDEEEEELGLEVNEVDMDQREGERDYLETPTTNVETDAKRYSDVEDKGQEDSQDEQEDDELEQREDKFVQQELKPAKQTDQDLGIVNQAFSDDAECDDKIEKDLSSGKEVLVEENEINPQTAQNVEYIPTDVDDTLDKEIEPMGPEEDESSEEDELTTGEYTSEKVLREDEVLIKDHIETTEKGFEPQYQDLDSFSSHQEYRSFADNVSEVTSPDTVPQPLPSPPEPKDMSPFDPNAPSDSPSPCHENLGQHGDTADENNTGDFLAGEVEGETKFGVDGTAITSTNTRNGTFIHSEDEEEEETEEGSQQLDQGCVTNTGNTETETSVDDRSGEYAGHPMESNDNALMSMSMEGSFYDDGGELIGGEDRRAQENHYQDEDSYEQQSIQLSQQIQNCFSQPSQEALGQQDTYTHVSSAVNGDIDSILDAPVTAPGLQTPVTEHDSSVDVTESKKFHTNDYASHLAEGTEEAECPGESSIDAVGISSPPDESTHNQEDLEEALGSIQISEPAAQETAEEPSSSVDVVSPEPKSDDALAAAAAPAAVAGFAAAAAAAAVSTTKTTSVKKSTSAKAGAKTSTTTTTTKAVKETKTTNGKPASAKKIEVSTTTVTKTTSKKPTDSRPASAATTEKKSPAKPAVSSPTKSAAPKATGPLPSYAQPITPRKPREAKPSSPEEKKKTPTPRTPSASARTPKTQSLTTTASSTTTTTITKTTVRTTSAAASTTTTSRTAQLARPKSSPTKLTNGTSGSHTLVDNNKSPTKKTETKSGSGTVKVSAEKKEIKVTSKIDAGTKSTTPKSPTKPSTPKTPSASTPKTGEVKEGKEIKSKIGSLEKTNHTPGGGNVKITTKKPDFTNVTSKIGSKDKIDHKPGGGNIKIETKKLKIEAKSKIGSLENATHKPAGGDKKIEVKKMEWNAKSKVGSLENATHVPGGGDKKILSEKLEWKSGSRVGSLDNAKHEPGGGNVKIESRKLDFKEKASPKIGSLDSKKVSTSEEALADEGEDPETYLFEVDPVYPDIGEFLKTMKHSLKDIYDSMCEEMKMMVNMMRNKVDEIVLKKEGQIDQSDQMVSLAKGGIDTLMREQLPGQDCGYTNNGKGGVGD
ncbi:microtubule-associated protein 2-like isoform X1 [Biomphalaria pfeifferi]|uniref:Microtubule-associated protein n=1 Tax=Biomphalaria pfeifferi TaxID=112525 RepID=A0AAD8F481_BIOPF|nr:microtubule-associated protein 2-like isoform X1 [Biomphalaria pfeifferi]